MTATVTNVAGILAGLALLASGLTATRRGLLPGWPPGSHWPVPLPCLSQQYAHSVEARGRLRRPIERARDDLKTRGLSEPHTENVVYFIRRKSLISLGSRLL